MCRNESCHARAHRCSLQYRWAKQGYDEVQISPGHEGHRDAASCIAERIPFTTYKDLINIVTGVHADSSVNVEKVRKLGHSILDSMTGKSTAEYSFNHAITFSAKSSIKVDGEKIQVDPQLVFQRLIIASQSLDDMNAIFKYELCSYPPSLFDSSLMLLKPQKPSIGRCYVG